MRHHDRLVNCLPSLILLLCGLLLTLPCNGWSDGPAKMDASLSGAMSMQSDPVRLMNTIPGVTVVGSEPYINAFIEMEPVPPSLGDHGVEVVSRAGSIYLARLPVASLADVAALPGVVRMEGDAQVESFLNLSAPAIRANEVWESTKYGNLQGAGVIVGMVDTGITPSHQNFIEFGGTQKSRIEYVWDMSDSSGPPPSETCRDYTQEDAPEVSCQGTECSPASGEDCAVEDEESHGTLVMGAFAGNGQADCREDIPCSGIAPRGEIVVVKPNLFLASEVLQGVDYIFQKATELGKPAVVNLSLGWYTGSRDGNSLLERHLSNLIQGEGRVVVTSAGNTNLEMAHARIESGALRRTLFIETNCKPQDDDVVRLHGWYDNPDSGSIQVRVLYFFEDEPTAWVSFNDPIEVLDSTYGRITIQHDETSVNASGFTITLDTGSNTLRDGQWHIEARNTQGSALGTTMDLWVDRTFKVGPSDAPCPEPVPARFTKDHQEREGTIGPPCTADNVICVGSYNTRCTVLSQNWCTGCSLDYEDFGVNNCVTDVPEQEDDISSFSSQGPTRDGRQRPWITAPGNAILTANTQGDYSYVQGTSLSSPHVAGTVALMLQADPTLTSARVFEALRFSASSPSLWDEAWGWGIVDAFAAVERVASEIPPPPPPVPEGLGEGDDICFIATAAFGDIDAPQVRLLREMRDRTLMKTSLGRGFVNLYYRWSPPVASWLKEHSAASRLVRASLLPAVGWSEMVYHRSRGERALLFAFGLSLVGAVCYFSVRRRTR